MKRPVLISIIGVCGTCCLYAGEKKGNFYLPESKLETKVKETKKSEPRPEPVKAEKRKTVEPPLIPVDLKLRSRKNTPDKPFDPPADPFGLAKAFHQRWDFSSFIISTEEELKFRLDAARGRTLRLARAFSALSGEVEERQRNLNSAALAAYLLSRDQQSWSPIEGISLTSVQMLAVRTTMQQDIRAMHSALSDYEILRTSLNSSAEEVAALEKQGLKATPESALAATDRPTVPTAEVAHEMTAAVLSERTVSVEALKATLAAENLQQTGERRQSIASFAPPPPGIGKRKATAAAPPVVPSAAVMKNQPRGESMKQPKKTALVFPTTVNAPVHAVKKGVVVFAGPFRGYGNMVIIEHEKRLFSIYSHLGNIQVIQRQSINEGAIIGRAGNPPELGRSGIHFQVRKGKTAIKPEEWLGSEDIKKALTAQW